MTGEQRNYGLDLARALAISMALFIHLYDEFIKIDVGALWYTGYFAMDIFFALSGFLIGGMLIKLFDENNGMLTPHQTWIFLLRRWFRTVPLYYVVLMANFFAAKYIFHTVSIFDWRYFFWVQNIRHLPPDFFGESWSLCVEEWFYFSFAAGLCILSMLMRKWKAKPFYKIVFFCAAYIIAFNIIRMRFAAYDTSEYNCVLFRLDATAYGVLIAILYRYKYEFVKRKINLIGIFGVLISIVGICIFLSRLKIGDLYIYYYPMIGLGLSLCMLFLKHWSSKAKRLPLSRAINFTSRISYSYYLINMLVIFCVLHFFSFHTMLQSMLGFISALIVILLISLVTYNFIEMPFMLFRDKYVVWKKIKK
jgi:peptidoglycan/LPS O-acetylase OafA/YrhL